MNTIGFPNLGIEFEVTKSINIFGLQITWYAILIAVGFLLGAVYAFSKMKKFGIDQDKAIDAIIVGMIGGVVGARLYYVVFTWDMYKDDLWSIFKTWEGGMAIYGAIIGGLGLGVLMCKFRKVKILPMVDLALMAFLIGQAIGRWGNFINIEAYGKETTSFFGMTSNTFYGMVHPCFLYESIWCAIGFVLLHLYSKRRKFDGEISLMYMMWYGAGRTVIEGLRTDSLYIGSLRVSQILSALMVIFALITWISIRSKIKRSNDPEFMKPYGETQAAKDMLLAAEQGLAEQKNKAKKNKGKNINKGILISEIEIEDIPIDETEETKIDSEPDIDNEVSSISDEISDDEKNV